MSDNIETNKLFVGNIHWNCGWKELKDFFEQWGEVEYASISMDRETRRSRGFGFVTFVETADAAKAKEEANEQELLGRPIYIDFARARPVSDEQEDNEEQQQEETEKENNEEQQQEMEEENQEE